MSTTETRPTAAAVASATPSGLAFSKMHGAGNDFVVLDLRDAEDPSPDLCRALTDRRTGVGCDLVLGVGRPRSADAAASYRIWAPDGSPSQQCGNGARCVAAWAVRAGLARGPHFALESPVGTHAVDVLDAGSFRIAMGVPRFAPRQIPLFGFEQERDVYDGRLGDGTDVRFAAVSMGNPHAVIDVRDVDEAPVATVGPAVQDSGLFLPTVCVGFAQLVSRSRIRLRVHEYGAGETLACGTGACAAVASLIRRGLVEREVAVELPGGELRVDWPGPAAEISLTGPTAFTFEGTYHHALV